MNGLSSYLRDIRTGAVIFRKAVARVMEEYQRDPHDMRKRRRVEDIQAIWWISERHPFR